MKIKLLSLLSVVSLFASVSVHAGGTSQKWDCSVWTSNVPGTECYKPPVTAGNSLSQSQGQSQQQSQSQGQTANGGSVSHSGNSTVNDTVTSNGGSVSHSGNSSVTDTVNDTVSPTLSNTVSHSGNSTNTNSNTANGGQGGAASSSASNQGNNQSVNVIQASEPKQAPSLFGGSLIVPQCGAGAGAGASGPGYGAFANVIWTPHDCKLLRVAGALQALGMYIDACKIVIHTDAFLDTYHRYHIDLPMCQNPVPQPVVDLKPVQPVTVNITVPEPVKPEAVSPPVQPVKHAVKAHKSVKKAVKKMCQPTICVK